MMGRMKTTGKLARLMRAFFFLAVVGLAPAAALGQTEEEEKPAKSYVPGYALTVLSLGLGIFAVVKPGKRKYPKIRRKEDEEEDIKPKH
jgi:hypothetical protein